MSERLARLRVAQNTYGNALRTCPRPPQLVLNQVTYEGIFGVEANLGDAGILDFVD